MQNSCSQGVFPITQSISLGQFASPSRQIYLLSLGVTHVLNVSEAPSLECRQSREFTSIVWRQIEDLCLLDKYQTIECIGLLHDMLLQPDSQVYVHCIAGRNRSPTIVWLYLIACGLDPIVAKKLIEERAPDAVPGHNKLVDQDLINAVIAHGAKRFRPLEKPETIAPFNV